MRYRRLSTFLLAVLALALVLPAQAQDATTPVPEIAYEQFVLDNGLTLIVHEDRKAPIVAVNLWYHVGSKNEPDGRSGFAHLFEHLMFNGSEHFDDDYFQAMERIGATDLNGTTNRDRTNYFQNVPTSALDAALWMESDRMGHLLGAVDQAKLDEQRGVVQNEKRQGENQPYGQVWNLITYATYPDDHPYGHTVIGSMEDLNAAELEDVQDWFKTYYGPSNAVVVIAGDIDPQTAREKAEKYFGDIPPGPPIDKFKAWPNKLEGEQRQVLEDRVPQARVYKVWNVPEAFSTELHHLELAADVLTDGKTSRLYKRLVYEDQIATDVVSFVRTGEIGSQFVVWATARPGQDLTEVEQALDEEMNRFLAEGPTAEELKRVKTQQKAQFVRGIERIGGFGGKSDILAQSMVYGGSPDAYMKQFVDYEQATPATVQQTAQDWLSDGVYVLEVHPFPEFQAQESTVDRTAGLPETGTPPDADFPAIQRATLDNGMEVVLAERHATPTVDMTLLIDAGYASDADAIPGRANLAMNMLDEGTESRDALAISEELDMLGATLGSGSNLDLSVVSMTALTENLAASLDLYADVILNPAFPDDELERLRKQQLAAIQREKASPFQMALRVFPELLYGEGHAYSLPFTGSGTEESVSRLTREDLAAFHQTWFKPNNATLVVVGDVTMDDLVPLLEDTFGGWDTGSVPEKNVAEVAHNPSQQVYLMNRPGAQQSIIFAGHVAPPTNNPNEIAIETMNTILGGSFTSRINMNLREDKGWSYGARSLLVDARGQRPFLVYAPVQTDKTAESIQEISAELQGILSGEPVTAAELEKAKKNQTLSLAGRWETNGAVGSSINQMVRFDLPEDYFDTYAEAVRSLSVDQVEAAAETVVHPDRLVWVVVGDREVIEPSIRELGISDITLIDGDGNVIEETLGAN
ncbi:MAG: insulinase family protein [Bacteroidetes bacterium]|jgi:zinc protease|nr:insulinase family protein [Bacteroidota bacterium]